MFSVTSHIGVTKLVNIRKTIVRLTLLRLALFRFKPFLLE